MTDIQPYQFETEEPLHDEDGSDSLEESRGEPGTLTGVYSIPSRLQI